MDGVDVDGENRLSVHSKAFSRKPLLRDVFKEFHQIFRKLDEKYLTGRGAVVELGAGVAPVRDSYPEVLASDIVHGRHLDLVFDAETLPLQNNSIRAFYGQNCFHHFPHPDDFFVEADRALCPGGGAILLEPYYGPLAEFLYKRLFASEGFDPDYPSWETPAQGPMNGANQALSYIVFVRDRKIFEEKFPSLQVVHQELCRNHLKYLVSGGLNFRQLLPYAMGPVIDFLQAASTPCVHLFCLHHVIVVRKKI